MTNVGRSGTSRCLARYPRAMSSDPIANAAPIAARLLTEWAADPATPYLRENDLRNALALALQEGGYRVATEWRVGLWESWSGAGRLGGFDLAFRAAGGSDWSVIELKWCDGNTLYELLWDILKAAPASSAPGIAGAYVVAAASEQRWQRDTCGDVLESKSARVRGLLGRRPSEWEKCLAGNATARPLKIRERLDVSLVADIGLTVGGKPWQLRAASVRTSGNAWAHFRQGVLAPPPAGDG